jgi:hypothetical protein
MSINWAGALTTASGSVFGSGNLMKPNGFNLPCLQLQARTSQTGDMLQALDNNANPYTLLDGNFHHVAGYPNSCSLTAGAGAGTGPAMSLRAGSVDGAGTISVTTGTAPTAAGIICTVNFGHAYNSAPRSIVVCPANPAAAGVQVWEDSTNRSTTAWNLKGTLAASTGYTWNYWVIG